VLVTAAACTTGMCGLYEPEIYEPSGSYSLPPASSARYVRTCLNDGVAVSLCEIDAVECKNKQTNRI
jgi:hypothetical protein